MERKIAKIEATTLGWEDHGIFTCFLHLDYGDGGHQGAGGYALDEWNEAAKHRIGTAYGMEFIVRLMQACGVTEWSKLVGRTVFAVIEDGLIRGIEPLPTEKGTPFMFNELQAMVDA